MRKRKKKALAELEDIEETLYVLIIETSHGRCAVDAALEVVSEQLDTIRKGITLRKRKTQRPTIEGIIEKFFDTSKRKSNQPIPLGLVKKTSTKEQNDARRKTGTDKH